MTMQDLNSNVAPVHAIAAQSINQAGGALVSGNIDLAGFNAAQLVVHYGNIDEMVKKKVKTVCLGIFMV